MALHTNGDDTTILVRCGTCGTAYEWSHGVECPECSPTTLEGWAATEPEHVAAMLVEAHEDGYAAGCEAGYRIGYEKGHCCGINAGLGVAKAQERSGLFVGLVMVVIMQAAILAALIVPFLD